MQINVPGCPTAADPSEQTCASARRSARAFPARAATQSPLPTTTDASERTNGMCPPVSREPRPEEFQAPAFPTPASRGGYATAAASRCPQNSVAPARRSRAAIGRACRGTRIAARVRMRSVPVLAFVAVASLVFAGCGSNPGPSGGSGGSGGSATGGRGGAAVGGADGNGWKQRRRRSHGWCVGQRRTGRRGGRGAWRPGRRGRHGRRWSGRSRRGRGQRRRRSGRRRCCGARGRRPGWRERDRVHTRLRDRVDLRRKRHPGRRSLLAGRRRLSRRPTRGEQLCVLDLTYQCMPIPSACNGSITCSCAIDPVRHAPVHVGERDRGALHPAGALVGRASAGRALAHGRGARGRRALETCRCTRPGTRRSARPSRRPAPSRNGASGWQDRRRSRTSARRACTRRTSRRPRTATPAGTRPRSSDWRRSAATRQCRLAARSCRSRWRRCNCGSRRTARHANHVGGRHALRGARRDQAEEVAAGHGCVLGRRGARAAVVVKDAVRRLRAFPVRPGCASPPGAPLAASSAAAARAGRAALSRGAPAARGAAIARRSSRSRRAATPRRARPSRGAAASRGAGTSRRAARAAARARTAGSAATPSRPLRRVPASPTVVTDPHPLAIAQTRTTANERTEGAHHPSVSRFRGGSENRRRSAKPGAGQGATCDVELASLVALARAFGWQLPSAAP